MKLASVDIAAEYTSKANSDTKTVCESQGRITSGNLTEFLGTGVRLVITRQHALHS